MARLTPQFSANRTVREYTEQHYLPLAHAYLDRTKDKGKIGADVLAWRRRLEEHWPRLRFGLFNVATDAGQHTFSIQVWLDELAPDAVAVELYADGQSGNAPLRYAMTRGAALVGSESGYTWTVKIPADRPAADFTPRVVPWHAAAQVPLECQQILWYR
jgi:starch phosphorylase